MDKSRCVKLCRPKVEFFSCQFSKEILENLESLIKNLKTDEEIPSESGSPEKNKEKKKKQKPQVAVERTDEILSSKPLVSNFYFSVY